MIDPAGTRLVTVTLVQGQIASALASSGAADPPQSLPVDGGVAFSVKIPAGDLQTIVVTLA